MLVGTPVRCAITGATRAFQHSRAGNRRSPQRYLAAQDAASRANNSRRRAARKPPFTSMTFRTILPASTRRSFMADVFIYDALRTPRGRGKPGKGGLSGIHPQELLAQTLNTMAERRKLDKNLVQDVQIGCVTQTSEQGACIARVALIAADWPDDVT